MPQPPIFTKQVPMFLWIWENRPHFSEISGESLGNEMSVFFMAHILPKSLSKRFKCDPRNICLMTPLEHHNYDHATQIAKRDPRYNWVFEMRQILKAQDHKLSGSKI